MDENSGQKEKMTIEISGLIVGVVIAIVYLGFMFLIPHCVPEIKNKLTSIRLFPYIIFLAVSAFSIAFAVIFRKNVYKLDLGIWPLILGSFLYYYLIRYIGFYVSTFLIIIYVSYFWKFKRYILVGISAVVTPVMIYLFFTLGMGIHMPTGLLF